MTQRGRADYYADGDWNAVCYECGRKRKASTLMKHWQGYYVCPAHWEPRQPQDFAKGIPDVQTPPWSQPMPGDVFAALDYVLPADPTAGNLPIEPTGSIPPNRGPAAIQPSVQLNPPIGPTTGGTVNLVSNPTPPVWPVLTSVSMPIGVTPFGIAITPNGATAYVTDAAASAVYPINLSSYVVGAAITVGNDPVGIRIDPAGIYAYVANSGDATVSRIRLVDNTVTATITLGGSGGNGLAITPSGALVYVAQSGGDTVAWFDTSTLTVGPSVAISGTPYAVAITPNGSKAYIARTASTDVAVIAIPANTVTSAGPISSPWTGSAWAATNPTAALVYTCNLDADFTNADTLTVINTTNGLPTATIYVGRSPRGIEVNPAGTYAVVANQGDGTAMLINLATNTVQSTAATGGSPTGVAINLTGTKAYIADGSGYIHVLVLP